MGILLDLLKAAASEASPLSKLGFWRQRVSAQVDSLASSSAPAQYLQVKNGAEQALVGLNVDILLQSTIASSGVERAGGVSEKEFVLTAGRTYHLLAHGFANTFSDPTGGRLLVKWVDANNASVPQTGPDSIGAEWRPTTNTEATSADQVAECVFVVPADATLAQRTVHLRCTAATGTATIPSNGVTASIVEIK